MNATDIIKKVKNENTPIAVWYGTRTNWNENERDTSSNPNYAERITGFFTDREEAWNAIEAKANEHEARFGEYDEFDLRKAKISPDDLDGIDWEELEEFDNFDDEKLFDLINEECYTDWDDTVKEVSYSYPSVAGAILAIWGWERYVGYSRMIHEIRYGIQGEDESICCPIDHTYRPQASVIATAEEIEGLSKVELHSLLETKLLAKGDWRWTLQAFAYIRHYLKDLKESAREEQSDALIHYAGNLCNSDAVLKAFGKTRTQEFEAALGYFQKEYDAVPCDAEGPNEEQEEQLNDIVEKYVDELNNIR